MKNILLIGSVVLASVFLFASCEDKAAIQACKNEFDTTLKTLKDSVDIFDTNKDDTTLEKDVRIYFQNTSKTANLLYNTLQTSKTKVYDVCTKDPNNGKEDMKKINKKITAFSSLATKSNEELKILATQAKTLTSTLGGPDAWKLDD